MEPGSSARTSSTRCSPPAGASPILDDLSTGRWENLVPALNRGVRLHAVNVTDARAVARVIERNGRTPSSTSRRRSTSATRSPTPSVTRVVNMVGTVTMLQAAQRAGVRRFVLASTGGAIYGDADVDAHPRDRRLRAGSPYAASKAAAESYLDLYRELHGLSTLSLRLANVYGPRQNGGGRGRRDRDLLRRAADPGPPVTVYGDGGQTRDFVYVGDVVAAFLAAAERPHRAAQHRHGRGDDACWHVARTLGLRVRHAPERPGEVRRSCLDPSARRHRARLARRAPRSTTASSARSPAWLPPRIELESLPLRREALGLRGGTTRRPRPRTASGARRAGADRRDHRGRRRMTVPLRASTTHALPAPTASAVGKPSIRVTRRVRPPGRSRCTVPVTRVEDEHALGGDRERAGRLAHRDRALRIARCARTAA